jgi:hypothetical protein
MTVTLYEMHFEAAHLCFDAQQAFVQPGICGKAEAIELLALARFRSFFACLKACKDLILLLLKRVVKISFIPVLDNFSHDSAVRACIAAALGVALAALRILSSIGGVISPELTFGVLKVQRHILRMGLMYRSQFSQPGALLGLEPLRLGNDQRWRGRVVARAMDRIDELESQGAVITQEEFRERIWCPAEREAREEEMRACGVPVSIEDGSSQLHELQQRLESLSAAMAQIIIRAERNNISPEAYPILEAFQQNLVAVVHQEAVEVCRLGLYTQDEVEDVITAYMPIVRRAACKVIANLFRRREILLLLGSTKVAFSEIVQENGQVAIVKEILLANGKTAIVKEVKLLNGQSVRSLASSIPGGGVRKTWKRSLEDGEEICIDDLVLSDGRQVEGRGAGGLEEWKAQLLEILLLWDGMSETERAALPFHLCVDEQRVLSVVPSLLPLSSSPVMDRCFRLIGQFFFTFVIHHLPTGSTALNEAFLLDEPMD